MEPAPQPRSVQSRSVATQQDILEAATAEFAANGYAGARVDEIAARTRTTKRMIYYHYGSKEALYLAVLERAYAGVRMMESGVEVGSLTPAEGLRQLAEATYEHHTTHPDFMRLVSIENIHCAQHLKRSPTIVVENAKAITTLEAVLRRGVAAGVFRPDVDAIDVHMMISAFACFHVANRYTFEAIFGRDMLDPGLQHAHRRLIGDMVVATLLDLRGANLGHSPAW